MFHFTFALTANFWKKFLYSARFGSQPRNRTDLSSKTLCINSTSALSRLLQKSAKYFLLVGWKTRGKESYLGPWLGKQTRVEKRSLGSKISTHQRARIKTTIAKTLDYHVSTQIGPALSKAWNLEEIKKHTRTHKTKTQTKNKDISSVFQWIRVLYSRRRMMCQVSEVW